jgi:hypothetical protein
MTDRLSHFRLGERLTYPTWKSLVNALYSTEESKHSNVYRGHEKIAKTFERLDAIRAKHDGFHPELALQFVEEAEGTYHTGLPLRDVKESMDRFHFGSNEFHSVYHIPTASYSYISPRIENILGIKPEDFTLERIYSMMPEGGLHHPEDIHHVLRWGNLAYVVLAIPGFVFRANDDHYLVRHRMNVRSSSIKELRDTEYVLIEKRAYLCHDSETGTQLKPSMHLDRWTVLDDVKAHYVRPQFVTSPNQSALMNSILYLLNAMLINVPVKFLLLLNERIDHDRNKAIANNVCDKIKFHAGIQCDLDDQKVADCFAKTIRSRMKEAINTWEPKEGGHQIKTDTDAVKAGLKLGLLPIPPMVEKLIYRGITDV